MYTLRVFIISRHIDRLTFEMFEMSEHTNKQKKTFVSSPHNLSVQIKLETECCFVEIAYTYFGCNFFYINDTIFLAKLNRKVV